MHAEQAGAEKAPSRLPEYTEWAFCLPICRVPALIGLNMRAVLYIRQCDHALLVFA